MEIFMAARSAKILGAVICVQAALMPVASAQSTFPAKPITIIVPAAPGGGTDAFARRLADLAEPILGQKILVENRPGGGGTLGVTHLVASRPDGYTLSFAWNGPLTSMPHTIIVPYSTSSYRPLMSIGFSAYVFCVRKDFPAQTAQQLMDHLKANPGKYTYGMDGNGGTVQLAAERVFQKSGVHVRGVPFSGAGEVARRFLSQQVDIYGGSIAPILASATSGEAKCLLLSSMAKNDALPGAEGLDAIGLGKEETVLWWGLIAPAGIPEDAQTKLEIAFGKAAETSVFQDFLIRRGAQPRLLNGKAMEDAIRTEMLALGEVAQSVSAQRRTQ
jgi:tripartite-type tricarboxylate transporter receptor subunit TctC